jgi:uncharacterized membrane protein
MEWVTATLWLLGARLIMAAVAGSAGLIDVLRDRQIRSLGPAWLHGGGNVTAVLIELYIWYARYRNGANVVLSIGIILSGVVVLILLFTGWQGWGMVYRHRVGVAEEISAPREEPSASDSAPPFGRSGA